MLGAMGIGGLIGIFTLAILAILIPYSVYTAQKWAYKCYMELKKMNESIDLLLSDRNIEK